MAVDSQDGGECQVILDYDTVGPVCTGVQFWNTSPSSSPTFSITNDKAQTRQVSIPPSTGSPANPQIVTPPFNPGNWTPGVAQNTSGSGPPYISDGTWSITFINWR